MRKKEREVTRLLDIIAILDKCPTLRLAFSDSPCPYLVPVSYAWQQLGESLVFFFHSAKIGRKMELIRTAPRVGFETDRLIEIVKNDFPCSWGACFESVIGQGTVSIVEDEKEKTFGLNLIMQRYGFQGTPQYNPATYANTEVVKITVDSISAKRFVRE